MSFSKSRPTRRNFLLGAAPAIAGGIALSSVAAETFAQPTGGQSDKPGAASEKIWSKEYWAQKGDIKLYMFRKRAGAAACVVRPI